MKPGVTRKELLRQAIHVLGGMFYAALFIYLPMESALISVAGIFFAGAMISMWHGLYGPLPIVKEILTGVQREDEAKVPGKGGIIFTAGVLLAAVLFFVFGSKVVAGAIIVLAIGDGASTLVGKALGRTKIYGEKTLEGSATGIIAAGIALSALFPFQVAFAAALIGMLAEYLPLDDNFTVPVATGAALAILG